MGVWVGGVFFPWSEHARDESGQPLILPDESPLSRLRAPVTAITLGAGSRGNTYGDYAAAYPDRLNIVGVAEPIPIRQERYAAKHAIPDADRVVTWEHVFERPKFADAIIISTPDDLHYGPAMAALRLGYDVLLEKPMAATLGSETTAAAAGRNRRSEHRQVPLPRRLSIAPINLLAIQQLRTWFTHDNLLSKAHPGRWPADR
mgnify:CR=1 FL=1